MTVTSDPLHTLYEGIPPRLELPADAFTDVYWRAALLLLTRFGERAGKVWDHVGPHGIDFTAMVDEPFSGGELLVVLTARALFTGDIYEGSLTELAFRLDPESWARLMAAFDILHHQGR
jgi:hypothetical protein